MSLRVDQFQTFVDGYINHPEAGVKACEKKLKKDPKNSLYLIALAQFQWKLRLFTEALSTCYQVLEGISKEKLDSVLLAEIQWTIVECQHGLEKFDHIGGPKLAAYWKQALDNATGSSSLKSRIDMFQSAWRDEYWDLAQQLFARLQKEYPTMPQYHFAWIAFSQLQADTMKPDDKMAQSLKMLAFRSLKSAFDNTINEKETGKKITTSHQLRLAVQIYNQQQQYSELLTILQNPKVGITSIGMNDGEFLNAEIKVLQKLKSHSAIFDICHSRLEQLATAKETKADATTIDSLSGADDWFVWKAMVDSALASAGKEPLEKVQAIIERILKLESANRNAGRALLTIQAKEKKQLLENCLRFFDSQSSKLSCFGDLRDFLAQLSHQEQGKFLTHIDQAAKAHNPFIETEGPEPPQEESMRWVSININALKSEYFLCVSKVPLPEKESLENFVSDALRMYKLALGVNKECGEEACILAVIGLVKLHHFARDFDLDDGPLSGTPQKNGGVPFSPKSYLIQALYLLEFLRFNNKHNYSAILLSTTIYQALGLTTLAASTINDLKLKEVQHDTASHLFWSRISISHPHNCGEDLVRRISKLKISGEAVNSVLSPYAHPAKGMDTALYWYEEASDRISNQLSKLFENIPFDKVQEFVEFKQKFQNSFTRALITLESRRVHRIMNLPVPPEALPANFQHWTKDNRDFDTIPDFEYPTTDKFHTFVTTRPAPSRYWLARQTANDVLASSLILKPPFPPYLTSLLTSNLSYLSENVAEANYQLTASEQFVSVGWDIIAKIFCSVFEISKDKFGCKDVKKEVQTLADWTSEVKKLPQVPQDDPIPQADFVQDLYLRIEILQTIVRLADFGSTGKGINVPKDKLSQLKTSAKEGGKAINELAKNWKQKINSSGAILISKMLKAGVTGEDVSDILDLGDLDRLISSREVLNVALDTVEGLEKVSV